MLYAYQLRAHPNARYQESLLSLSQKELRCMLTACGISAEIAPHTLGGTPFLCFEADAVSPEQQAFLSRLSGLYMTAVLEHGLLRPLTPPPAPTFLPADMPEILKYKGKTNPDFTRMLLNLALAAGGQWRRADLRVLDPMCGRGTTLYCALTRGMNAVGVESDKKSVQEGLNFVKSWLRYHRIKHSDETRSLTLPDGKSAPAARVTMSGDGQTQTLEIIRADTRASVNLDALCVAAPREDSRVSSFSGLLSQALPAWRQALKPGCAAAIAFNTYTLKRSELERLALDAGFLPPPSPDYADFSHWVEQAVDRDVLVVLSP